MVPPIDLAKRVFKGKPTTLDKRFKKTMSSINISKKKHEDKMAKLQKSLAELEHNIEISDII